MFATRFTLEAVEAVGAGRSWDGHGPRRPRRPRRRARSSSRPRSTDGRSFSLLAIVREYAIGRLKERGEADAVRAAHADYYRGLVRARRTAICAAPVRPTPSRSSASSCRTCAPRCATSSTPTASTTPATSRGACSSTGGSPASSPRCGVWMLELLGKELPITAAHPRASPGSSRCGARCGSARPTGSSPGSASACGCSPRAATRMPRRWRSPRARRRGCSCRCRT